MTTSTDGVLTGTGVGSGVAVGPVVQIGALRAPRTVASGLGAAPGPRAAPGPGAAASPGATASPEVGPGTAAERQTAVEEVAIALEDVAQDLRDRALRHEGALAEVLDATAAIAAAPTLRVDTGRRIRGGIAPVAALTETVESLAAAFRAAGGVVAERVVDLESVRDLVIDRITGRTAAPLPELTEPSVVVARDLAPADLASLDLERTLALVLEQGTPTAHTAIIARLSGLPCLVRTPGAVQLEPGTVVAVDAAAGTVTRDPDAAQRSEHRTRGRRRAALVADHAGGATRDGRPIALRASVGSRADAEQAAARGADGAGLVRTEVMYFGTDGEPPIDRQAELYATVLRPFTGRRVVVRTFDSGADKPLSFAERYSGPNPALGIRGFRLVRSSPGVVRRQLEALARAARAVPETEVWVMAPMISTPLEARSFAAMARGAGLGTVGAMIEVPAAALRADRILSEVDFVSVGTNDLAQYTMAADRQAGGLEDLLDPWQPAVLDLVQRTAGAGEAAGSPVGICGESASDPVLAPVHVGLGVASLSMAATAIPEVRYVLRSVTFQQCRSLAETALAAPDAETGRRTVLEHLDPEVTGLLGLR